MIDALKEAREQAAGKKKLLDNIAQIEALPQAQRWRAIKDFLLKVNPKIREIDRKFCEDLKATRNAQLNEFGSSKSGDVRNLLDMPVYMYEALILCDREFNHAVNISRDRDEQKATWRKVAEVFPEYRIAHSI